MIWLIEGMYFIAMVCGVAWLISRIMRFVRMAEARKEAEARWAETFSEDDFQAFLETLRQKRDNQANGQQAASQNNEHEAAAQPNSQSAERA